MTCRAEFGGTNAYFLVDVSSVNVVFAVCVVQTRSKSVLDLVQDIVMQTTSRLAAAATLKVDDPRATVIPFALATFNSEYTWANE